MAIEFQHGETDTGTTTKVTFQGRVIGATPYLTKFDLGYDEAQREAMRSDLEGDHHLREIRADAAIVGTQGREVTVRVDGQISDGSGNHGGGTIGFLVVAETE